MGRRFKLYPKSIFSTSPANQSNQPFFSPALNRSGQEQHFSLLNVPTPQIFKSPFGIMATVYFIKDASFLDTTNFNAVKYLAEELKLIAQPDVLVNGHASTEGNTEHNLQLSESRRNMVITLLKYPKSISQPVFGGKGFGSTEPAVAETGKTESEAEKQRSMNRRVEITISYPPGTLKFDEKTDKPGLPDLKTLVLYGNIPEAVKKKWDEDYRIRNMFSHPPIYHSMNDIISEKVAGKLRDMGIKGIYNKSLTYLITGAVKWGEGKVLDAVLNTTDLNEGDKETIKKMVDAISDSEIIPEDK
jgi:outer membrane protein OmpA-like peptidoglycan-associated protein